MGVGHPCSPVRNDIVTPRHLRCTIPYIPFKHMIFRRDTMHYLSAQLFSLYVCVPAFLFCSCLTTQYSQWPPSLYQSQDHLQDHQENDEDEEFDPNVQRMIDQRMIDQMTDDARKGKRVSNDSDSGVSGVSTATEANAGERPKPTAKPIFSGGQKR